VAILPSTVLRRGYRHGEKQRQTGKEGCVVGGIVDTGSAADRRNDGAAIRAPRSGAAQDCRAGEQEKALDEKLEQVSAEAEAALEKLAEQQKVL